MHGMKSSTSPTPSAERNLVTSTFVSGQYSCLQTRSGTTGATAKRPPFRSSSSAPNTLGESKSGRHSQSIEPRTLTSAAVRMLPMRP